MGSTLDLIRRLVEQELDFVLVGGMAAAAHGSSVVTQDVDLCVRFDLDSVTRILRALSGLHPQHRMHPSLPPLADDPNAYVGWRALYIATDEGQLDLLSEITGVGIFDDVSKGADRVDLGGFSCRIMAVDLLIQSKKALGRPKDLRVAAELQAAIKTR